MPPATSKGKGKGKGKGKMKVKPEPEAAHVPKKARKSTESDAPAGSKKAASLSKAEREAKTNALVRFLLFASTQGRPIQYKTLIEEVLATVDDGYHYNLIERASEKLEKVFGLTLALLPPPDSETIASRLYNEDDDLDGEDGASQAPAKGRGARERYRKDDRLVVLNCIKKSLRAVDEFKARDEERWGLAMSILALVYVAGMEVTETQLIKFLKDTGVQWNKGKHAELKCTGAQAVQDLVSQRYLYKKQGGQSGDVRNLLYRWGPRAMVEVSEGDVISFLADVYEASIEQWADMLNRPIAGIDDDEEP